MPSPKDVEIPSIELRFLITRTMAQALHAIMTSKKIDGRRALLVPVIQRYIEEEVHAATMLVRCVRGTPLELPVGDGVPLDPLMFGDEQTDGLQGGGQR